MERSYWEKIAPAYNDEIFDVLANDKKGIIKKTIKRFASKESSVIDIGCAIGKWLPILSPAFKKVYAVDISHKNLDIAADLYPDSKNVKYERIDTSDKRSLIRKSDIAICINAILTATQHKRDLCLSNLQ